MSQKWILLPLPIIELKMATPTFCCGSMINANCIIPMPVAVDCLMKWAEISVQELPVRPAEVSFSMEAERVFFPWEMVWEWFKSKSNLLCSGSRLSICSSHKALFNIFLSLLNFPSPYWWWMGRRQETITGCRWRASSLLLSSFLVAWNLQKCVRRTVLHWLILIWVMEVRIKACLLLSQCESTGSSVLLFCVSWVVGVGLILITLKSSDMESS